MTTYTATITSDMLDGYTKGDRLVLRTIDYDVAHATDRMKYTKALDIKAHYARQLWELEEKRIWLTHILHSIS